MQAVVACRSVNDREETLSGYQFTKRNHPPASAICQPGETEPLAELPLIAPKSDLDRPFMAASIWDLVLPLSRLSRVSDVNNRLAAVFAFAFHGVRSTTRESTAFFRKSTA